MSAVDIVCSELLQSKASVRPTPLVAVVDDMVAALQELQAVTQAGAFLKGTQFGAAGAFNFNPLPQTVAIWGRMWGAGGGGGGAIASAGNITLAISGGNGGYVEFLFPLNVAPVALPIPFVIGAGGAGGDASGSSGLDGGVSTFGTGALATAANGRGGAGDAVGGVAPGTALMAGGGNASAGGFFSLPGAPSNQSVRISGTLAWSGDSGAGFCFPASRGVGPNQNGAAGARCSGGAAAVSNSAVGRTGGAGGNGQLILMEFGG